jgi:hypothetical protein
MEHLDYLKDLRDFEEAELLSCEIYNTAALICGSLTFKSFVKGILLALYKQLGIRRFVLWGYWRARFL